MKVGDLAHSIMCVAHSQVPNLPQNQRLRLMFRVKIATATSYNPRLYAKYPGAIHRTIPVAAFSHNRDDYMRKSEALDKGVTGNLKLRIRNYLSVYGEGAATPTIEKEELYV